MTSWWKVTRSSSVGSVLEMSAPNAAFRQEPTRATNHYKQLLAALKSGGSGASAADLGSRLNEIVTEGKDLTRQFDGLYDEWSRVAFRTGSAMYRTEMPATVSSGPVLHPDVLRDSNCPGVLRHLDARGPWSPGTHATVVRAPSLDYPHHDSYHDAMERTTISIPDDVLQRLRIIATEQRISLAGLVRAALADTVRSYRPRPRSLGIGASAHTDTARRTAEQPAEPRPWR
jgi:hypothetical protein